MQEQTTTATPATSGAATTTTPVTAPVQPVAQPGTENKSTGWFYADGVPGVGDKPDFLIDGKYKSVADQAKAYKAKQGEIDSKLKGFAGAPEKYEVKVSEELKDISLNTEDPLYQQFTEFAKTNGMTNEAYNNLVNLYLKHTASEMRSEQAKVADYQAAELKKLGEKTVAELPVLEQWGKNNLPADLFEPFRKMVSTADAVRLFMHFKDNMGGSKLPNLQGAVQENLSPLKLREMMADPRYNSDMQYQKEVNQKYQMFYKNS